MIDFKRLAGATALARREAVVYPPESWADYCVFCGAWVVVPFMVMGIGTVCRPCDIVNFDDESGDPYPPIEFLMEAA